MTARRKALLLAMTLALAGCGGDFGNLDDDDGSGGDDGNLRLVNASQTGFLDLYRGSTTLASSVGLYAVSSYASVSEGTRSLSVRAQGSSTSLASPDATVVDDDHQALVAYTAFGAASNTVTTTFLPEDEAAPAAGSAKLRILNVATASSDAVDVFVVTTACSALVGLTVPAATASSVTGLQSSYASIPSSTTPYRVCVTGAGARADVRLDLPSFTLTSLRIVTLIFVREPGGALKAVALDQQGAIATVPGAAAP